MIISNSDAPNHLSLSRRNVVIGGVGAAAAVSVTTAGFAATSTLSAAPMATIKEHKP